MVVAAMMLTHAIAAIAAAVVAASSAWHIQYLRYDGRVKSLQAQHAQVLADARDKAAAIERGYQQQLNKARDDATKRETKLRRDAAAARAAADGLRDGIYQFRAKLPTATQPACAVAADTAAQLLGECSAAYQGLAETADRIASDRQTLIDAWPKYGVIAV